MISLTVRVKNKKKFKLLYNNATSFLLYCWDLQINFELIIERLILDHLNSYLLGIQLQAS